MYLVAFGGMRVIGHARVVRLAVSWLTLFLVGTELFVVSPLLPLISKDFQSSPALSGLSVAIFAVTYMISAPLFAARCMARKTNRATSPEIPSSSPAFACPRKNG